MKINEIILEGEGNIRDERLAAISQLIVDRSEDENVESKMSVDSFIHIANRMGLSLSPDSLMDLAQSGDLKNIIKDVNQEEIIFKGKQDVDLNANMTVDRAKDVVKKMAKRQLGDSARDEQLDRMQRNIDQLNQMSDELDALKKQGDKILGKRKVPFSRPESRPYRGDDDR